MTANDTARAQAAPVVGESLSAAAQPAAVAGGPVTMTIGLDRPAASEAASAGSKVWGHLQVTVGASFWQLEPSPPEAPAHSV